MKKTAIFGASGGGQKVAQTFDSFGISYDCFVDNNKEKWGTFYEQTPIIAPKELKNDDYQIIIASEHQAEIEQQLEQMGLLDRLILKEDLILPCVRKQREALKKEYNGKQVSLKKERTVIIDLSEGVQLGKHVSDGADTSRSVGKKNKDGSSRRNSSFVSVLSYRIL